MNPTRLRTTSFPSAVLLLLSAAVAAQATSAQNEFEELPVRASYRTVLALDEIDPVTPRARRMVVGEFLGDHRRHAILIADDEAHLVRQPAVHEWSGRILGGHVLRDGATLRGIAGDPDQLLTVGSVGLLRTVFAIDDAPVTTVVADGPWTSAAELRVHGDASAAFVAALSTDGRTILVGALAPNGLAAGPSMVFPAPVSDVAVLDWNGDAAPDVAVVCDGDLLVFDGALQPLAAFPGSATTGRIAVLRRSVGGEQLAWLKRTGAFEQWRLSVADASGDRFATTMSLPLQSGTSATFDLVGITTGDANRDGNDDVLIAQRTTRELAVLLRVGADAAFVAPSLAEMLAIDSGSFAPSTAGDECIPAFADLDGDLCADVLLTTTDGSSALGIYGLGEGIVESVGTENIFGTDFTIPFAAFAVPTPLKVHLVIPEGYLESGFDWVQITIWREAQVSGHCHGIEPLAVYNRAHPLVTSPLVHEQFVDVDLNGVLTALHWPEPVYLWAEVRFRKGAILEDLGESSSSFLFGVTLVNQNEEFAPQLDWRYASVNFDHLFDREFTSAFPLAPRVQPPHGPVRVGGVILPKKLAKTSGGTPSAGPLTQGSNAHLGD